MFMIRKGIEICTMPGGLEPNAENDHNYFMKMSTLKKCLLLSGMNSYVTGAGFDSYLSVR